LRQSPAGLDRMTAPAVRGGFLQVTSQGVIWLPLGSRLVDRLRARLSGTPQGRILAGPDTSPSPILEVLRAVPRSQRDLPVVLCAEWSPRSSAARSLKDTETLGDLEWGAAAVEVDQEADWIGAPVQIVAGRKSFEAGGVEMRTPSGENRTIRMPDLIQCVLAVTGEVM
jgi:hypothetical protein